MFKIVMSWKKKFPRCHLCDYAATGPNIGRKRPAGFKCYFWTTVLTSIDDGTLVACDEIKDELERKIINARSITVCIYQRRDGAMTR